MTVEDMSLTELGIADSDQNRLIIGAGLEWIKQNTTLDIDELECLPFTLNQGSSGDSNSGSSEKSKEKTKVIPYKGKGSSTLTATERANAYITAKENAANSSNSSTDGNNDIVLHDIVHGYNIRMLLQYHINTAAIINISSSDVNGVYRVRKGTHIFNDSECVTECEVVDKV